MDIIDKLHTTIHAKGHEAIERAVNYVVGGTGIGISLVEATTYLQFIAAGAGAILVCRQLYRDISKKR